MIFKILYVEDNITEARDVKDAVEQLTGLNSRPIEIEIVKSPEELQLALQRSSEGCDLVLADVVFPTSGGRDADRLDDIIKTVRDWSSEQGLDRALPIIAYTSAGRVALDNCLARRGSLYDIWDKSTARPAYVAWRFNQLALELTRARPDALLQRKVRGMGSGASWHELVCEMTRRYDAGKNEHDQIDRAAGSVRDIAGKLELFDVARQAWGVMVDWEVLSRSVSRRNRGHARHVVNVFWLGYYLLHQPVLKDWWESTWLRLQRKRAGMDVVAQLEPLEALSGAWFSASIFHDTGGCVEKQGAIVKEINKILDNFSVASAANAVPAEPTNLVDVAHELFVLLGEPLKGTFLPLWQRSVELNKPDHGVIAALHLLEKTKTKRNQLPLVQEGARAIMLHNMVGDEQLNVNGRLNWDDEPIACLLIFCDQIQTWDRERGDQKLKEMDHPERAELSTLDVSEEGCPIVKLAIEYLAPRHLDRDPERFDRVKQDLDDILKDKPIRALEKLTGWPFKLDVQFWLNGKALNTETHIGASCAVRPSAL